MKFCIVIKTTKTPFAGGPVTHITNPRWRTAATLENRKIAISRPRFDRFRPNLAGWRNSTLLSCPTAKNLKFSKSKMAAAAILENRKIAVSRPRFDWFRWNLATWRSLASWAFWPLKFQKFKNSRWRQPPSSKIEKSPYLGRVLTDFN